MKKPLAFRNSPRIDLHIHSLFSDGTFSPKEILDLAQNLHISAIAITDHDTIDGNRELLNYSDKSPVKIITGVELSSASHILTNQSLNLSDSLHILGYAIDIENPRLTKTLQRLKHFREERIPKLIKQLDELGCRIEMNELVALHGRREYGRPHIADLMVRKGFVASIDEAFDCYLRKGRPGFIAKARISCVEAIQVIREAGGVPVLAHPGLICSDFEKWHPDNEDLRMKFEKFVEELKSFGLMGIEAYYPEHTTDLTRFFIEVAKQKGLVITGGTDFHGSIKPKIQLGFGYGDLSIPSPIYEELADAARRSLSLG